MKSLSFFSIFYLNIIQKPLKSNQIIINQVNKFDYFGMSKLYNISKQVFLKIMYIEIKTKRPNHY